MADYIEITDIEIDPESPVSSVLLHKMRDNPEAIAEGATGAPRMQFNAIGVTAGDIQTSYPQDLLGGAIGNSYEKWGPGVICGGVTGSIRIKFALNNGNAAQVIYGQISFNGSIISPEYSRSALGKEYFSYDHTLTESGIIELYVKSSQTTATEHSAGELAIYSIGTMQFTRENLNSGL